jgi:Fur family ferric uptake transcriptional regulator
VKSASPKPDAKRRISERGGRVTPVREAVLEALSQAGQPQSHDELAARLAQIGKGCDRVTLYRTLDWLVSQGLAHRVAGADRAWRFNAVADEALGHAHFHCEACHAVFCLESLQPAIAATLPLGFALSRAELNFHGRCPRCADRASA